MNVRSDLAGLFGLVGQLQLSGLAVNERGFSRLEGGSLGESLGGRRRFVQES